jgi:hypothetical protein
MLLPQPVQVVKSWAAVMVRAVGTGLLSSGPKTATGGSISGLI